MTRTIARLLIIIALAGGVMSSLALAQAPTDLTEFDLLSANSGWVRLGSRLYGTDTGGDSWREITPAKLGRFEMQAAWFNDARTGWLALTQPEPDGSLIYGLARTTDGGRSWAIAPLSLFAPGDPAALAEAISLRFADANTGWLVVKQATSANFRVGTLFGTTDGGRTWAKLALPGGGPVYFASRTLGWTVGGPIGDRLYHSQDGGRSWQEQVVAAGGIYQLPLFTDARHGLLPVRTGGQMVGYHTADGGDTWQPGLTLPVSADAAEMTVPLAGLAADHWLILPPDRVRLWDYSGHLPAAPIAGPTEGLAGLTALKMAGPEIGWARFEAGMCQSGRCTQETRLLRTGDGGRTWIPVSLPGSDGAGRLVREARVSPGPVTVESVEVAGGSETIVFSGHGFDKCEIASLSQLQNWRDSSPYRAVNLYIGGVSRYCANSALSAGLITQLSQQGWQFIPTWVGPQAACTGYTWRMSSDLATAYSQGQAEAAAALAAAHNLGLTLADQSGTIIYYDLEYFDTANTTCYNAAKAFITGWVAQLRGANNLAGVYSTGPVLSGMADIPNVPDTIWPAHWLYSSYNPTATVWDVYRLSNNLWNQHQRIRQYTGGHDESWDDVTLNIDSNVIDGIVAAPHRQKVYLPLILR